ncbi:MAG: hypothetical protein ACRDT6_09460 [Micromonosporaceae bacterium]
MASKNQVTLTFAGDSSDLEKSFAKVGEAAKGMEGDVGRASKSVRDSADSYDRAGQAADNIDTKAMGFRDTMTGVQDTSLGVSQIMKGELFDGFLTLGMGIGDLGSGLYNTIIPALKAMSVQMVSTASTAVAQSARQVVAWAALGAKALLHAAQVALAWVISMGPIGLVIAAVVGLVVLIVKNFDKIKAAIGAAWNWVKEKTSAAWSGIKSLANSALEFLKTIPGKIKGAFRTVADFISAPFRAAFNGIKRIWNSTIGGKGFTVPGWVPIIGGKEFRIPRLHTGGIVPGAPGSETMALLQAGERITPAGRSSGGATVIEIRSGGSRLDDLLVELLRRSVRTQGGNVQVVLGS